MGLKETLNNDIKSAMRAKDQARLRTLRAIKSAIMLAETAEGRGGAPLTEDEDLKLLTKQAKQRRDARDQFKTNGRDDLAAKEAEELAIIEAYLPKALSEDEVEAIVKEIIAATGASTMKDMGKVMGQATQKMAGQADGKLISTLVRKHLG